MEQDARGTACLQEQLWSETCGAGAQEPRVFSRGPILRELSQIEAEVKKAEAQTRVWACRSRVCFTLRDPLQEAK